MSDSSAKNRTESPSTGSARDVVSAASAKIEPHIASSGSTTRRAPRRAASPTDSNTRRLVFSRSSMSMGTWQAATMVTDAIVASVCATRAPLR